MRAITRTLAKAKGRRLQQWLCDRLLALFPTLEPEEVGLLPMGSGGEDVRMSPKARPTVGLYAWIAIRRPAPALMSRW